MAPILVFSLSLLHLFCVVLSSPLSPGAEPSGHDYGVPYHTTQGFIVSQLKNFYNYLFNKPDSVHEDGYTKVYVMGKHMYYTYTHEFTQGEGGVTDERGDRITEDPFLLKYRNREEAEQYRKEVEEHVLSQKRAEEEARRKLDEMNQKDNEGIFKKAMRSIPILKRFVRDVSHKKTTNGPIKEQLKKLVEAVWSKLDSKTPPKKRIFEETQGKKESLGHAFKKMVKSVGQEIGRLVIPETVREMWPHIKEKVDEKMKVAAAKVPFLEIFRPGDPPENWPNPPPLHR